MMELKDTAEKMASTDYKERMQAEHAQLAIRYQKLKTFVEAAEISGQEGPAHDCPLRLLQKQLRIMGQYLHVLEVRANIEGVEL